MIEDRSLFSKLGSGIVVAATGIGAGDMIAAAVAGAKYSYALTAIFGIAIMIIAAGVKPELVTGNQMVLNLAGQLETASGNFGKWIFLVGFWGAVFSSMLGVWQGVPYLFDDFIRTIGQKQNRPTRPAGAYHKQLHILPAFCRHIAHVAALYA